MSLFLFPSACLPSSFLCLSVCLAASHSSWSKFNSHAAAFCLCFTSYLFNTHARTWALFCLVAFKSDSLANFVGLKQIQRNVLNLEVQNKQIKVGEYSPYAHIPSLSPLSHSSSLSGFFSLCTAHRWQALGWEVFSGSLLPLSWLGQAHATGWECGSEAGR